MPRLRDAHGAVGKHLPDVRYDVDSKAQAVIVLGIDPGSKPGYGYYWEGEWHTSKRRPHISPEVVVTEGIWHGNRVKKDGKKGATPQAISTLAFTAGRQISGWGDAALYRLPVDVWKNAVVYCGGKLPKAIFVKRLRAELGLSDELSEDEVEACGIAHAWALPTIDREKYRLKEAP